MKKSIIALAVAASTLGVAQANGTTLYGSVRMAYEYDDANNVSQSTLTDSGSRFGIRGSDDLGNGLSAIYLYENRLAKAAVKNTAGEDDAGITTHKLYAGLKGGFGQLTLGLQSMPADDMNNYSDPWNSWTPGDRLAVERANNSAVYWSPSMSGFQIGAAIVANGAQKGDYNDETIDMYQLVAKYEANGIYAGLGYEAKKYTEESGNADTDVISLGLGYGNDLFEVGLVADRGDVDDEKGNPLFVRLSGLYNVTPADAIYAGVSRLDADVEDVEDVDQYSLGYQHKFSAQTRVWTEYSYIDAGKDAESNKFAVGLRTDF